MATRVMHDCKCVVCGKEFRSWFKQAEHCSDECFIEHEDIAGAAYEKRKNAEASKNA